MHILEIVTLMFREQVGLHIVMDNNNKNYYHNK